MNELLAAKRIGYIGRRLVTRSHETSRSQAFAQHFDCRNRRAPRAFRTGGCRTRRCWSLRDGKTPDEGSVVEAVEAAAKDLHSRFGRAALDLNGRLFGAFPKPH
jgi:hypothetical protein